MGLMYVIFFPFINDRMTQRFRLSAWKESLCISKENACECT